MTLGGALQHRNPRDYARNHRIGGRGRRSALDVAFIMGIATWLLVVGGVKHALLFALVLFVLRG